MHLHILGICGTFAAGVALLAREAGHTVSGCDANVYPPMSTQFEAAGIRLTEGFDPAQRFGGPDVVVVGNVMRRGLPIVETLLDRGLPYTSGHRWLAEHILHGRWPLAVAGTHGTTTSSMLARGSSRTPGCAGLLIGGIPANFGVSARLGSAPFFVVEADRYDTAFFDKRSKFVHYRPRTAVLNNLEYDHADIFPDIAAIQRQFHHLVRTIARRLRPAGGQAAVPRRSTNPGDGLLDAGRAFGPGGSTAAGSPPTARAITCSSPANGSGANRWPLLGAHNVANALAAIAAARHAGVRPQDAIAALGRRFRGVARRMELRGEAARRARL